MLVHPKRLFLFDGIGALITASLLYFLLAQFEHVFGMPTSALSVLSLIAFCFSMYSFSCYFLLKSSPKYFLLVIALANGLYCLSTFALMLLHYESLTKLGVIYFTCEIAIVGILVFFELQVAGRISEEKNIVD